MFRRSAARWRRPLPVLRRADSYPHYDLCIIGGGPGGIAAAMRAASMNKKVCIVEEGQLGGRDIWNGTLQSKMLWEMGKFVSRMTTRPGFVDCVLDPAVIPEIKKSVSGSRMHAALQAAGEQRQSMMSSMLSSSGIDVLEGTAMFSNEKEVDIHSPKTGEYRGLVSDYFIIATGSLPMDHPLCPTDHKMVVNSDDIFSLNIPESLVVVGAGPMGCEFASIYASLGTTKVALIDQAPRILPKEDADVAASVQASLTERGVTVHQNCLLFDLEPKEENGKKKVLYAVQNSETGAVQSFEVERALVTIGRTSNLQRLQLENTKMRVNNRHLVVDEFNRCIPYDHIYCIGDAGADQKLVTMAQAAARYAVQDMFGLKPRKPVSSRILGNVTTDMYLDEEVACIGLNETQCRQQKIAYLVSKCENSFLARAAVAGSSNGFVKIIVTDDREKRVLGVRAIGSHAASVVETASILIRNNSSVYELLNHNPAYPSMVAGLVECARMLVGRGSWNSSSCRRTDAVTMNVQEWKPASCERGRAYCGKE